MLDIVTLISAGFSIVSAVILFTVYAFFLRNVNKSWLGFTSCVGLLFCLVLLQLEHMDYLLNGTDVMFTAWYRFWLFLVPSFFFLFSRAVLLPDSGFRPWLPLLFLPSLFNYWLRPELAVPLLFATGMAFSVWLASLIYGMRAQRERFHIEMFFFGLFSITAVFVLLLGVALPYIENRYFYLFYTNSIGVAFMLITAALMAFPDLLAELSEAARLSYSASTLKGIDVDQRAQQLDRLMRDDKLYKNDDLNLASVAEALEVSPHQLSELVNRHFGVGFSRYVREHRIAAAKKVLLNEPQTSVLAVGLETGFKTQSNFYAAFKEITGSSPGAYRKSFRK